MKKFFGTMLCFFILFQFNAAFSSMWDCEILSSEQKVEFDDLSGAKIIFITTHPAADTNLYFHKRCFLFNNRMMLFFSNRFGRTEIMGYLMDTGELVRLNRAQDPAAGGVVASINGDRLYVYKLDGIYEWKLGITIKPETGVQITETKFMQMPDGAHLRCFLDENCDGSLLVYTYQFEDDYYIGFYDIKMGKPRVPTKMDCKPDHLQFHRNRPDILAFSPVYKSDIAPLDPNAPPRSRIWFMNVNTRMPIPAFYQVPGELVTHECWWVGDQMTFLGGHHHEGDREEGNVKILDFKTGDIRIIGAGAWMDGVTGKQLAEVNWWHASGSPDGKWIAADNWHGIVALFNGKTTEKKILTTGHRIYGGGLHLHVGWDLHGKYIEFTSNKLGDPNVCLAVIPENW